MQYVTNAFSLQMLSDFNADLKIRVMSKDSFDEVKASSKSVVGHQDIANVIGVEMNRESVQLEKGDILYVAQLTGGRLPEGATTLPEGFQLAYLELTVS